MKNAINNQVGMLGDMFLWLVANLKQGVIYFIKQALPPNKSFIAPPKMTIWYRSDARYEMSIKMGALLKKK